jgi:hypothetical protein
MITAKAVMDSLQDGAAEVWSLAVLARRRALPRGLTRLPGVTPGGMALAGLCRQVIGLAGACRCTVKPRW